MSLSPESAVEGLLGDRSKLLAFIWSLLRDHHDTEDIFEEVVILAMKNATEIEDHKHLLAWARRAARHRSLNLIRRKGRQPMPLTDDTLEQLETQWGQLDAQPAGERMDALRHCVDQLTPQYKKIITLRYGKGLSGMEVAKAAGLQTRSVYTVLTRIYRSLEDCVLRQLASGGENGG